MTDSNRAAHSANLSVVRLRAVLSSLSALVSAGLLGSGGALATLPPRAPSASGRRAGQGAGLRRVRSRRRRSRPRPSSAGRTETAPCATGAITRRDERDGRRRPRRRARDSSGVSSVSLFGGEVTADALTSKSVARASSSSAGGELARLVGHEPRRPRRECDARRRTRGVALGDWGYAVVLEQAVTDQNTSQRRGHRGFVVGLHVHLTAAHGGLPAGQRDLRRLRRGGCDGAGRRFRPPSSASTSPPPARPSPRSRAPPPARSRLTTPPPVQSSPPGVRPHLTRGGYVFPSTARLRSQTTSEPAAPTPAGTTGTTSSRSGCARSRSHRRDTLPRRAGTRSAATASGSATYRGTSSTTLTFPRSRRLAEDGAQVKAGDVIGFVGATGDAAGTPTPRSFEIHPAALLSHGLRRGHRPVPVPARVAAPRRRELRRDGLAPPGRRRLRRPPQSSCRRRTSPPISALDPRGSRAVLTASRSSGEGPAGAEDRLRAAGFSESDRAVQAGSSSCPCPPLPSDG